MCAASTYNSYSSNLVFSNSLPRILAAPVETRLEIKRSEFICLLERANNEVEARQLVTKARNLYPDARHHCSAFVVSQPDSHPLKHSSDDGEPSGTAGRPMLEVLTGANLLDVSAVVVRYFGGTLLGTGGLVRAYTQSVQTALEAASFLRRQTLDSLQIEVRYDDAPRLENALRENYQHVSCEYIATTMQLTVAAEQLNEVSQLAAQLTQGRARIMPGLRVTLELPDQK